MASALLLARAGHHVTLFERVAVPGPVGAGLLLQPTGLHVLERLGLASQIRATGARIDRLLGTNADGRKILDLTYADESPDLHGVGIHRGALSSALWSAVRNTNLTLRLGAEVERVEATRDVATVRHRSGASDQFDLIVLADGTFSQLRSQVPIPHEITVYPWGAWWTILRDPERRYQGVLRQTYRDASQMLGIMPVGRLSASAISTMQYVTLFWSIRRSDEAPLRARGLQAWKDEVLALAPQTEPLIAQIGEFEQLIFATYADVRMHPWHDQRIVVIGDAAHATSPQLGQGANLALVDALVLMRCLALLEDIPIALAAYTAARRKHLNYYQFASSALTPMFQSDARSLAFLRDRFLPYACRMPGIRGQMLATLTGSKAGLLRGRLELD